MPEWISVNDRLPEPVEYVLVCRRDKKVEIGWLFPFSKPMKFFGLTEGEIKN